MVRIQLSEKQWSKIDLFLQSERGAGRPAHDDRRFVEAVLWWRRTGVPWRDLPSDFGPWKTVFNRFDRWAKAGKWERLFLALQTDRDDEWHSLDSTINRAHQHASGGKGFQRLGHKLFDFRGPRRSSGVVLGKCYEQHRAKEFISFLGEIDANVPDDLGCPAGAVI